MLLTVWPRLILIAILIVSLLTRSLFSQAQQHATIAEYEHKMNTMTDRSNQLEQQILELEIAHDNVQSETIDFKDNMKALEEKHAKQMEAAVHKQEAIQQEQVKEKKNHCPIADEVNSCSDFQTRSS